MAPPLRVLLLNNFLPPKGGAEAHVGQVCDLLRDAGHAVELHAAGEASGWADLRDRFHNPAAARLVRERIAEFRPDLVHVHNFLRRLSPSVFGAARASGVPTLLMVHDFQLFCPRTWGIRSDGTPCERPSLPLCALGNCRGGLGGVSGRLRYAGNALRIPWIRGRVARDATRIVTPSDALSSRLTAVLGREVGLLPYPFPPPAEPFAAPESGDLLFVGRVSPEKGLDRLLDALARTRDEDPPLRLTVAGDGPSLPAARERAARLGLGDRVRFEGWVDAARVPELLRSHGALVLSSTCQDNSPLAIHESLAAGRPVLASRRGGIPELVTDGVEGFLFEPGDRAEIAGALRRFRDLGPEERAAMARRARARAGAAGGAGGWLSRLLQEYQSTIHSYARTVAR